jgi:hypothetical protein
MGSQVLSREAVVMVRSKTQLSESEIFEALIYATQSRDYVIASKYTNNSLNIEDKETSLASYHHNRPLLLTVT